MRTSLVSLVSATALIGALGCGKVSSGVDAGSNIDANGADGSVSVPDAQVDAAVSGAVTVKVFVAGAPAEGVAVYYHQPDGSYIASQLTDASGETVIADMPVDGMVTAPVDPFLFQGGVGAQGGGIFPNSLATITGVQIGDVLTFGRSIVTSDQTINSGPNVGTVNVTMPGAVGGADRYYAYIPCDDRSTNVAGSTLTPSLREGCVPGTNQIPVFAYAEDVNDQRIAYSVRPTVNLTGSEPNLLGNVTMPNWSTDLGPYTINTINAPTDMGIEAIMLGFSGGFIVDQYSPNGVALMTGGNGAITGAFSPTGLEGTSSAIAVQQGGKGSASVSLVAFRDSTSPTQAAPMTKNINLSTELYGNISAVMPTGAAPIGVSWTAPGLTCKDNPTPDAVLTQVIGEVNVPAAFGVTTRYNWFMLSRGDTASGVRLPSLDPAIANSVWPESTFTNVEAGVVFKAHSAMTYDDVRQDENAFAIFEFIPSVDGTACMASGGAISFF